MYVYRFRDKAGKVLYVGKTKNMKNRFKQHFGKAGHLPSECYARVERVEYFQVPDELLQSIYELVYINKYKPPYNTKDKYDSKSSLGGYMQLQKQEWLTYAVRSNGWEFKEQLGSIISTVDSATAGIIDNIETGKETIFDILAKYKISAGDLEIIRRQFSSTVSVVRRRNNRIIKKLKES